MAIAKYARTRRRNARTGRFFSPGLTVEAASEGRRFAARLVDASQQGLGVEVLAPFSVGSVVEVAGELHGPEFCLGLEGSARVAHCRHRAGLFRMGLSLQQITYRTLPCRH
jgi:hypothetical protein